MMPHISIIIPVYNAEATLNKCVDSILMQPFADFEVILVDDGSKDRSLQICEEYARRDSRVTVIHKENGGVSSARNAALEIAKGERILFLDADDYLDKSFFNGVKESTEDLLIRGISFFSKQGKFFSTCTLGYEQPQPSLAEFVIEYVGTPLLRGPVAKFFLRCLIVDLRFPEDMKVGEDSYFVQCYLARCNSYKFLYDACYKCVVSSYFDNIKYACSVDYAASSLVHLLESFEKMENHLHVGWEHFLSFYVFFKLASKEDWKNKPWLWFANMEIARACKRLWPVLPMSQKIQYGIFNILRKR